MPAKIDPATMMPVPGTEWFAPVTNQSERFTLPELQSILYAVAALKGINEEALRQRITTMQGEDLVRRNGASFTLPEPAPDPVKDAVEHERRELARLFREKAFDHDLCASESADADERDDEDSHKLEADVWRAAAALVSERGKPAPAKPEPTAVEEDVADDIPF